MGYGLDYNGFALKFLLYRALLGLLQLVMKIFCPVKGCVNEICRIYLFP